LALSLTSLLATACAPKQDRRSTGTIIDDQTIETKIIDVLYSRPEFDNDDHVKVEAHNATLLLAGETKSEENKALATKLASELKGVERVVNELAVVPVADTGDRLSNSYITTKVNTLLMTKNPVKGFDPTRIKVITARKNVYLMGTVSHEEAEAVVEVVRNIGGVEKVIKVFDYTD
jgi:osmotically-inducible protein OsmY